MKYLLCILMLFGSSFPISKVHDFHLSKTDVHYKSAQAALQLTVHTFIDDTEEVLRTREDLDYKFFETKEHVSADSVFYSYLKEHLIIKLDGQQKDYYYLGKEQSEDIQGLYAYLEIEDVSTFKAIEITNSLLMDIFDDQKNIINLKVDNKRKSFHILTKGDSTKQIKL